MILKIIWAVTDFHFIHFIICVKNYNKHRFYVTYIHVSGGHQLVLM